MEPGRLLPGHLEHLAHAIGNALRVRDLGGLAIACINAAAYVDELIDALSAELHAEQLEQLAAAPA